MNKIGAYIWLQTRLQNRNYFIRIIKLLTLMQLASRVPHKMDAAYSTRLLVYVVVPRSTPPFQGVILVTTLHYYPTITPILHTRPFASINLQTVWKIYCARPLFLLYTGFTPTRYLVCSLVILYTAELLRTYIILIFEVYNSYCLYFQFSFHTDTTSELYLTAIFRYTHFQTILHFTEI